MAVRILMIDDDRLQLRLTRAQLKSIRSQTYELDCAETYEDGLAKLLSGRYEACLLDYQLGERDGLQLIREAASRGCRTPVIFLTAESSESVDLEAMNAGALDYLLKGEITPQALERSLRYALKLSDTLEALHRLATHDELTGLLNRREFERLFEMEQERARRFGHPLALAMVDVDRFKAFNDLHGHPAGDAVLREVGRRLRASIRSVDWATRFGGDEFALMLIQADRSEARALVERARSAVGAEPVKAGSGLDLAVTMSAGFAVMPEDAASGPELVTAADRALYAAKAAGKNQAAGFEESKPC
jgi:diguanylate cyclase (GGDEF)-like protein